MQGGGCNHQRRRARNPPRGDVPGSGRQQGFCMWKNQFHPASGEELQREGDDDQDCPEDNTYDCWDD